MKTPPTPHPAAPHPPAPSPAVNRPDADLEALFSAWRKSRQFCAPLPGEELHLPSPVQAHTPPAKPCKNNSRTCDKLGVCNCAGNQCEFELPDLSPISRTEWVLVAITLVAAIICAGLIGLVALDSSGGSLKSLWAAASALF